MPKGEGGKGASAKAAKAAHQDEVKSKRQQQAEATEAAKWVDGAKGKTNKEDKVEKAAALKAAKAERERLLAEEEASIKTVKPKIAPTKFAKKEPVSSTSKLIKTEVSEYSASNIDDVLDCLDIATMSMDKASLGTKAAQTIDAHPERRFKAAFEAYKVKNLPIVVKENPGLRHGQCLDLLSKQFKKHPDNPFNKLVVSYDATKEDKVATLKAKQKEVEKRLQS